VRDFANVAPRLMCAVHHELAGGVVRLPATMCQIAGRVLGPVKTRRACILGVGPLVADLFTHFRALSGCDEQPDTNANSRSREQADRERVTALLLFVAPRHLTTCFLVAHDASSLSALLGLL